MTWSIGLEEEHYPFVDQNTLQTVDGMPSENAELDCSEACLAAIGEYLGGVRKLPDEVHDEGWGQGTKTTSGPPEFVTRYARLWLPQSDPVIYHPPQGRDAAGTLYNLLYWRRPAMVLVTNAGIGHWVSALTMSGGDTSAPFDALAAHNPYGGTRWNLSYNGFVTRLRRYDDGNYLIIGFSRVRAVQVETRFGPQ